MNKKMVAIASALILVISSVTYSCKPKPAEEPVKEVKEPIKVKKDRVSVRFPIPIIESGQTTFYAAQDKGYYADENLEVKFEMGSKELNPVKMVASGQDVLPQLEMESAAVTIVTITWRWDDGKEAEAVWRGG